MIIGIVGFKQSGKDTFADWFVGSAGFQKYSFAKPLKEGTKAFFGWTDHQLNDPVLKELVDEFWGISPRQALQWLGTDALRVGLPGAYPQFMETTSNNIWVKRFERTVSLSPEESWVIPDVRFQNEVDAIKRLGGVIVRINRKSAIPKVIEHASENVDLLQGIDFQFSNEGPISLLHNEAFYLYWALKESAK